MTPAELLAAGGVLAIPTESSYGLGVDPRDPRGVEAIYRLKGRERGKALPIVAADVAQLLALGVVSDCEPLVWARPHWPAAITMILPLGAPIAASAGVPTIAARIPAHEGLRTLLARFLRILAGDGESPLSDPVAVRNWLATSGEEFLVVDQGETAGGPPSTLVELRDGEVVILRKGRDEIR